MVKIDSLNTLQPSTQIANGSLNSAGGSSSSAAVTDDDDDNYEQQQQQQQQQASRSSSSLCLEAREQEIDLDKVQELRALMRVEYEREAEKYAPNHYGEIMNPSSARTCWRYISHRYGSVGDAFELMKASLIWRKENGVDDLNRAELAKEMWHFSPLSMCGQTRAGDDVFYVLGRYYRKPDSKLKQSIPKFAANIIFGWDREHDLDLKKMHAVFDVSDTGYRNIDMDFMSWAITIKDFVPARWHQFSVVGIPFIVRPLVSLIISWLPEQYSRIVHCGSYEKLVKEVIDDDNLPVEVGGTRDESYKMAPIDAPWASESPIFSSEQMFKQLADCIKVTKEKQAELHKMQLNYEKTIAAAAAAAKTDIIK